MKSTRTVTAVRWGGTVTCLVLLTIARLAAAQPVTVVVPNAQATAAGNENNSFPFDCGSFHLPSMRYQQVYRAAEMGLAGAITEIRFRRDAITGAPFGPTTLPNVTMTLSSTTASPEGLSSNFFTNLGPDETTVFTGNLTLSSAPSTTVPRPFDIVVPLRRPFYFDAGTGRHLLLNVTLPTCLAATPFDLENTPADSVGRILAPDSCAPTGTPDTAGLVTQFTIDTTSPGQAEEFFVANASSLSGPPSITVFSRTANGNTTPLRTLSGPATALNEPTSLVVSSTGGARPFMTRVSTSRFWAASPSRAG